MNSIIKSTLKLTSLRGVTNAFRQNVSSGTLKRPFTRTLWYMCSRSDEHMNLKLQNPSSVCNCGCGSMRLHTKGEKELVEFLTEEITAERKLQKTKNIPTEIDGFKVKLDGSEVTLTKTVGDETIEVNFNINHTVDSESEPEINPTADKPDVGMRSKPTFEVDVKRGNKTLGFTCSFISPGGEPAEDGYTDDIFGIDELTLYEGEWKDSNYAVAGEVLDGYLYDLLMNFLEEKGISNEFVEKISDFSTAYEHSSYITLLENLQKFSSGK